MKLLVTGTHGQLASALRKRPGGDELVFVGRPAFDLTRPETIAPMVEAVRPAAIISAAAYTDVNGAETDAQTARAVNGKAPGALAQSAAALGIPLVHFSTDYVFDGQKPAPYRETDPCAPLGVYGSSKLDGEEQVRQTYSNHAILRTSWVYSPFGKNFVRTMLELARSRDALQVVNDQFGNPTSALDLADGALQIAHALASDPDNRDLRGTFHMVGADALSWAEFAVEIFRLSAEMGGPQAEVEPVPTSAFPSPVRRPANSRLDGTKLAEAFGIALPGWRLSLASVIERLLDHKTA